MIMVVILIQLTNEALFLSNYQVLVLITHVLAVINFMSRCLLIRSCFKGIIHLVFLIIDL